MQDALWISMVFVGGDVKVIKKVKSAKLLFVATIMIFVQDFKKGKVKCPKKKDFAKEMFKTFWKGWEGGDLRSRDILFKGFKTWVDGKWTDR